MPEPFFRFLLVTSAMLLILAAIDVVQLIRTRHTAGTEEANPDPSATPAYTARANQAFPGHVTRYPARKAGTRQFPASAPTSPRQATPARLPRL